MLRHLHDCVCACICVWIRSSRVLVMYCTYCRCGKRASHAITYQGQALHRTHKQDREATCTLTHSHTHTRSGLWFFKVHVHVSLWVRLRTDKQTHAHTKGIGKYIVMSEQPNTDIHLYTFVHAQTHTKEKHASTQTGCPSNFSLSSLFALTFSSPYPLTTKLPVYIHTHLAFLKTLQKKVWSDTAFSSR